MVLDKVADLVHDDVVEHVVRRQHEPPVEAERALARARAPAAALVAQRDPLVRHAERRRLRLRDQRDARLRLTPPLLLGEGELVQVEARLRSFLQLTLEPREVGRDRVADLTVGRARPHDELGREPEANDEPVPAHAVRAAYVQLDRTATYLQDAHRCTVGVVSDDNACARHAHLVRRARCAFLQPGSDPDRRVGYEDARASAPAKTRNVQGRCARPPSGTDMTGV
jgi:hypothetical protein